MPRKFGEFWEGGLRLVMRGDCDDQGGAWVLEVCWISNESLRGYLSDKQKAQVRTAPKPKTCPGVFKHTVHRWEALEKQDTSYIRTIISLSPPGRHLDYWSNLFP